MAALCYRMTFVKKIAHGCYIIHTYITNIIHNHDLPYAGFICWNNLVLMNQIKKTMAQAGKIKCERNGTYENQYNGGK